jgi:sulfoxide reductase catalytic subunit YedY
MKIRASDITPKQTYLHRRQFLGAILASGASLASEALLASRVSPASGAIPASGAPDTLVTTKKWVTTSEPLTPYNTVTTYNNFYEFGTNKSDPARNAGRFKPKPWSVIVQGACARPGTYTLEDILKPHPLEERVYRFRCVEGWSMVVPWIGFPLADLLKRFGPSGNAKYVEFLTVLRPDEMIGQSRRLFSVLPWPYSEGLRMDEAMHPLSMMAVGLYGETLPNQNGAPLRLVVPWKYGFKSIKSIAEIRFVEKEPRTSWMKAEPQYYGFYSNVNPDRTHSQYRNQSTERRLGDLWSRKTMPFNGYADQVASMYAGMDLRKLY